MLRHTECACYKRATLQLPWVDFGRLNGLGTPTLNITDKFFEAVDDLLRREAVGVHLDRVGRLGQSAEDALDIALVAEALLFEHHFDVNFFVAPPSPKTGVSSARFERPTVGAPGKASKEARFVA